jgi:hypothetical protein
VKDTLSMLIQFFVNTVVLPLGFLNDRDEVSYLLVELVWKVPFQPVHEVLQQSL